MIAAGMLRLVLAILLAMSNVGIQSTTWEISSPRIPAVFDGYCVVQVSDLHNSRFGPGQRRLVQAIRREAPDLIALTGDLVDADWRRAGRSLELVGRLGEATPICFVIGNHDSRTRDLPGLLAYLQGHGVRVLRNASSRVLRGGEAILLSGIDDPEAFASGRRRSEARAAWRRTLAELRESVDPELFTILLTHRPEPLRDYAALGFDLVLSGHAHGGQIRLPFVGALYAPDQGILPRYTTGLHVLEPTRMIVSRGLARGMTSLRLLNRPQIVVVRLRAGSAAGSAR